MSEDQILGRLAKAIIDGDEEAAKKFAHEAVDANIDYLTAVKEGIGKPMETVGKEFEDFRIFLPQLMKAGEAGKAAISVLKAIVPKEKLEEASLGRIVIGTIYGDIHDIGKNIAASLLSAAGFEVHDIGVDNPAENFINKAKEVNGDIIAISCLITPSLPYERDVLKELEENDERKKYYVIIGGASTTPDWAKEIGADGWGLHAEDGVEICKKLMIGRPTPPLENPILIGRG